MVSLKDISLKCGVSIATVSKALNDQRDISAATKVLVRNAAREMGYFPNSSAIALKTNRSYNIGVLFADEAQSGLTQEYFAHVLDSFKDEIEKYGYDITFINRHIKPVSMSYYDHSKYRGVDGVLIACTDFYDLDVYELINGDIPVITIDHVFNSKTSVISDNVKGINDLLTYIYSMGHRKIAYIHGQKSSVTQNRLGSFYKTMEQLNLSIPSDYVVEGIYHDPEDTADKTRQLLNLYDRPTCIIFPDDFAAIGGINVIKEEGLRIPEDISIVGYDGILLSQIIDPRLTTLEQDTRTMGRYAAEKLIEAINNPKEAIIERVVVPGNVVYGNSVLKINNY